MSRICSAVLKKTGMKKDHEKQTDDVVSREKNYTEAVCRIRSEKISSRQAKIIVIAQ